MSMKTIFVVMPFSSNSQDIWELGIKETAEALGFECMRADEILGPGFIVDQIYDRITEADIVIGEMTGRNPNVFYEIGFAHALGKPTILLASSKEDLQVFDTQGFRHFLHNGSASQVRKFLKDILPNVNLQSEVWPSIPAGEVIYEWPSPDYEDPVFLWKTSEGQIDENGGQSIKALDPVGKAIVVSNTDKYWNWQSGCSIMRLGSRTNSFCIGDSVTLLIEGRTSGAGQLKFIGDGGWLDPQNRQQWGGSWHHVESKIKIETCWHTWMLKTKVQPTNPNYDPAKRGTTVYLVSSIGKATAFYKRIQLVRQADARV